MANLAFGREVVPTLPPLAWLFEGTPVARAGYCMGQLSVSMMMALSRGVWPPGRGTIHGR
jgi:hypothetical protein